ncbi:hypothetical protein [Flavobacterium caseinilyticum]|uniref:Uncharacterized protein n=1 Tax=Flavobacterium caseinilyticum TaxID=2541732 RepID=A0A4V2YTP8_9FLAO|nr:hypothetical protein [Flavobacterium caseinilyticum]TDD74627.1 hypothetical protein E0F89_14060 [Flavobacterium caseinilyticum]
MNILSRQQLQTQLEQISNAVYSKLESKYSGFSAISQKSGLSKAVNNTEDPSKPSFVPALGGIVVGGGVYYITKSPLYSISSAVIIAGLLYSVARRKSDNTVNSTIETKMSIDFEKSKSDCIQLVLTTNEELVNAWYNQLENLKSDLQSTIQTSQKEQSVIDENLDFTYVFLPLTLNSREWRIKIDQIAEDGDFESKLKSTLQQWKNETLIQIKEVAAEQWNEKFSKINL